MFDFSDSEAWHSSRGDLGKNRGAAVVLQDSPVGNGAESDVLAKAFAEDREKDTDRRISLRSEPESVSLADRADVGSVVSAIF